MIINTGILSYLFRLSAFLVLYYTFIAPVGRILPSSVRDKIRFIFFKHFWQITSELQAQCLVVEVFGETIASDKPPESAIIISNHQSINDYMIIGCLAKDNNIGGQCYFFQWGSCFRIPHPYSMIRKLTSTPNWRLYGNDLVNTLKSVLNLKSSSWVAIFPEGEKSTEGLITKSNAILTRSGLKPLKTLIYPRYNGFNLALPHLRKYGTNWVYDFTISYYFRETVFANGIWSTRWVQRTPKLKDFLFTSNPEETIRAEVYIEKIEMAKIPKKKKKVEKWLENRWYEKDLRIQLNKIALEKAPGKTARHEGKIGFIDRFKARG